MPAARCLRDSTPTAALLLVSTGSGHERVAAARYQQPYLWMQEIGAGRAPGKSVPRSPKLHGSVERADRTHTEECDEVTDGPPDLAAWEVCYNTIRPHRAWATSPLPSTLASIGIEAKV